MLSFTWISHPRESASSASSAFYSNCFRWVDSMILNACFYLLQCLYFCRFWSERGAARIAHYLGVVGVAGSNPVAPTGKRESRKALPFFIPSNRSFLYFCHRVTENTELNTHAFFSYDCSSVTLWLMFYHYCIHLVDFLCYVHGSGGFSLTTNGMIRVN